MQSNQRWNAEQWLRKFEEAKRGGDTHPSRQEVFRSTLDIVKDGSYESENGVEVDLASLLNDNALKDNAFCERKVSLIDPKRVYHTVVRVFYQDCLEHARELLREDGTPDLCVLNLASPKTPGGNVWGGAGAQEEYLFRCSDYYRFLYQYANPRSFDCEAEYGIPHHPQYSYPLNDFGGVFSRGVTVFRDKEANGYALLDTPWRVNFVAVAAMRLDSERDMPKNFVASTEKRIRAILRIAYNNGQRRLVLGALGCGAFNNPPQIVAECFKRVLAEREFNGLFRVVDFAIIEDHNSHNRNFNMFAQVLSGMALAHIFMEEIEEKLRATGREGIDSVMAQLRQGGFYRVPASLDYHNNCVGGLAKHSWEVCLKALELYEELKNGGAELPFGEDSVVLCSILHDLCKMDEYTVSAKGRLYHTRIYDVNKKKFGNRKPHGMKSVDMLLKWGLRLTDEEKLAIRWHMGEYAYDAMRQFGMDYAQVERESHLVRIIRQGDSSASTSKKRRR